MLPGLFFTLVVRHRHWDIVLVSGYRVLGIAAVAAARLLGKRVVLKADNDGEMSGAYFKGGAEKLGIGGAERTLRAFVAARNLLLRRADHFVSLSSTIADELIANGVPPAEITRIPNSVDISRFKPVSPGEKAPLRAALGLPTTGPVVVFTGRLLQSKGVLDLVQSWAELAPDFPDATLVIVGSGQHLMHSCEAELHESIAELGLGDRVVTTGFVTNVESYLKAADIFAFPTTEEAFGISAIEAMAAGLAVVATRVGGLNDIIDPEVNGLQIEAHDQPALTAALRRLLADPGLCARLGQKAMATVEARYTTDAVLARYAELFRRVAAGRHGRR
jgi:glycosyltransferase involved in cell wall biosynthesis